MYDLIVLGAGPAGYAAAIRASQLGMKVVCIEKRKELGGTCLNVGCIPSKALLESSERYFEMLHTGSELGIEFSDLKIDLAKFLKHKDDVVKSLTSGIDMLFKKYKVDHVFGEGKVISSSKVQAGDQIIETKKILIATGSKIIELPNVIIDETHIVSSTGALSLPKIPKSMIVVGGGYIGLELGSVWSRLGTAVTVVEGFSRITPQMDEELSSALQKTLEKQGLKFELSKKIKYISKKQDICLVECEDGTVFKPEIVLVSVGRTAFSKGFGLEELGVQINERSQIIVNENYETSVNGIYAVGDVIPGPMLAHKAMEEGVVCVERMARQKSEVNYKTVPSVIYTHPEVASVGQTEQELKNTNIPYKTGKFPFLANGRAKASKNTQGFVKILAHAQTDEILGVHCIGHQAGTMIQEAVVAMEFKASAEDLARIIHAHPTLNEAFKEAACAVEGHTLHL